MPEQDTLDSTPTALTQLSRFEMMRQGIFTKPNDIQTFTVKYGAYSESWDRNAFDTNKIDYWGYDENRKEKGDAFEKNIGKAIDKYIKYNKKVSPVKITDYGVDDIHDLYNLALVKVTITKNRETKVYEGDELKTLLSSRQLPNYTLKNISDHPESKYTYMKSAAGPGEATIEVVLDMTKLNDTIRGYQDAAGGRRRSTRKYKKSNKRVKSAKRTSHSRKYRSRK